MTNNFLDEKGRKKVFSKIADDLNEAIQDHLKETSEDSVQFSIGMFDFDIKAKKEIEND